MDKIVFPMKVLAVKLEFRRQLLERMPKGFCKIINGIQYVIITTDPDNPKYNARHSRKIMTSSKLGKKYSEKINDYLNLKSEYDSLLNIWKSTYSFSPPRVVFPIIQPYDPHCMNNDYFNKQLDKQGKYIPDNPTISEHGVLKSKNEQIGADILKRLGIPFKYETEIYLPAIGDTINPDYLVNFYEIDRCAYLELLGMNDRIDYSVRSATKITGFSKDKYRPGREVIYVHVYDKYNFDESYFTSQVLSAFNDLIPDSALIWESQSEAC
ncbi:MAG: hypothetical protein K6G81_02875 [Lachnospiraceae bacterium]|nr:hypothetical protein [Lachnospiraceae bacterium]